MVQTKTVEVVQPHGGVPRLYYNVALQMCDQSLEFMSRSLGNTAGEEQGRTDLAVWTLPTFINCQWPKV